jgi:hypothetical protein
MDGFGVNQEVSWIFLPVNIGTRSRCKNPIQGKQTERDGPEDGTWHERQQVAPVGWR